MTGYDAYRLLLEHVERHPDAHTFIHAINKLRDSVSCVDCDINHGSLLEMRRQLRVKNKKIRTQKKQLNLLMIPRPHRKIYTLPEVLEQGEDVNEFEEAVQKGIFAPWRY